MTLFMECYGKRRTTTKRFVEQKKRAIRKMTRHIPTEFIKEV
jgi:hypothetical protein